MRLKSITLGEKYEYRARREAAHGALRPGQRGEDHELVARGQLHHQLREDGKDRIA